jgi:hypothetical protein
MIFFDGWGLGSKDATTNPFLSVPMPTLRGLLDGTMPTNGNGYFQSMTATVVPTDATLGVPGLPQSATGQTTILTGVNAPQAIGEHSGPYPNPALREILSRENLYHRLLAANRRVAFANAYPPFFFDRLQRDKARRSAMAFAAGAANVRYRTIDDLRVGDAVSTFVTNDKWIEFGADVPLITPREAGRNLARIAQENDFALFEYFLTDAAGHKSDMQLTAQVIAEVDEILRGVLDEIDPNETLLLTTSDHGNIEDTSAKGHTLNPVPTLLVGKHHADVAKRIHALTDLTPTIADVILEQ